MKDNMIILECKLAKIFLIFTKEAFEIIYEEWQLVEEYFMKEINNVYRIA